MSEAKTLDEAIKKIHELEDRNCKLRKVVNRLWDAGYDVLNLMDNEVEELDYVMERDGEYKKLEDWTYEDGVGGENGLDPIVYGHKMVLDRLKFIYNNECFKELSDALEAVAEMEAMDPSALRNRIEDLEEENEALGNEVTEWMGAYNDLKEEYDELNYDMIQKNVAIARDTNALIDILHFLQNLADGGFDSIEEEKIDQMCGRIKKYLAGEDW